MFEIRFPYFSVCLLNGWNKAPDIFLKKSIRKLRSGDGDPLGWVPFQVESDTCITTCLV